MENLPPFNEWWEVMGISIVGEEKPWHIYDLEDLFRESITVVANQALKDNNGAIYTTLSGGVDSSLCLAMIAEICPPQTPIHTFTIGGSVHHPDVQHGREVARMFNTTHHETVVNHQDVIREFGKFYGDSPETENKIKRGDVNTWATYREIARFGVKSVVAHDGIDELMGGYWPHCETFGDQGKQEEVFNKFWQLLEPEHLTPLGEIAHHFGIKPLFPYLQRRLVEYIAHIPVGDRSSYSLDKTGWKIPNRKKLLREIARKYIFPKYVVDRQKYGFINALNDKPPFK